MILHFVVWEWKYLNDWTGVRVGHVGCFAAASSWGVEVLFFRTMFVQLFVCVVQCLHAGVEPVQWADEFGQGYPVVMGR